MSAPTIVIVGRREFQLDANFTACWILALLLRLQTQLFKTESVDGFFCFIFGLKSTPLTNCFISVSYGWIVFERISKIEYHYFMIDLFCKSNGQSVFISSEDHKFKHTRFSGSYMLYLVKDEYSYIENCNKEVSICCLLFAFLLPRLPIFLQ